MTRWMVRVLNKLLIVWLIDSNYDPSIGKKFFSNGNRYEGDFKDDKAHGQGKT